MPITFGSVGDIIGVSLLIKDLVKCLDESRGSSAEYQTVIRELWSLDYSLLEVELLLHSCKPSVELSGLRETANRCAEQCRRCVEDFRDQTKRYQRALQRGGTRHLIGKSTASIRWRVSMKDDLAKFRAQITAQSSSLNMLLATAGVKLTILKDEGMHKRLEQSEAAYASSSATQTSLLADLNICLDETKSLIQATASETQALISRVDLDYFRKLGVQLLSFVHNIWKMNCMTYNAVVNLQASIPAQLNRTWTQEPAILEDALRRVTPFHLEFIDSWEVFENTLEARFRKLPGHRKVKRKEYALRSSFINKDVDSSIAFNRCFLPGRRYDMSMIFNAARTQNSCPACHLDTGEASDALVECKGCGLSYQRIMETVADSSPVAKQTAVPSKRPCLKSQRDVDDEGDDEPKHFCRVRMRCRQRARKEGCQDGAEAEVLANSRKVTIRCICGARHDLRLLKSNSDSPVSLEIVRTWLTQCIGCKVWQHRRCVGTANGNDPPGGYDCEQCRKANNDYTYDADNETEHETDDEMTETSTCSSSF